MIRYASKLAAIVLILTSTTACRDHGNNMAPADDASLTTDVVSFASDAWNTRALAADGAAHLAASSDRA